VDGRADVCTDVRTYGQTHTRPALLGRFGGADLIIRRRMGKHIFLLTEYWAYTKPDSLASYDI